MLPTTTTTTTTPQVHIYGASWAATQRQDYHKWPQRVDILLTHTPPEGIRGNGPPQLLRHVIDRRVRLHLFGHCHYGRGAETHGHTTYVNCSSVGSTSVDFERFPVAPPVVCEYEVSSGAVRRVVCEGPASDRDRFYGAGARGRPHRSLTAAQYAALCRSL